MAYRFPGMDPYLEAPSIWRGFHHSLAEEIRARLNQDIGSKYYADVEITTTFEAVQVGKPKTVLPDVAVLASKPRQDAGAVAVAEPIKIKAPVQ